jgi:tetratricopeptide (TPR) repeat protein
MESFMASAIMKRGGILGILKGREHKEAAYDMVIARFGEGGDCHTRRCVVEAWEGKAGIAMQNDRQEEAVRLLDEIVSRYGKDEDDRIRGDVVRAMDQKATILLNIGHLREALQAYDETAAQFGRDESDSVREKVISALMSKGSALCGRGFPEGARDVYRRIIVEYEDNDSFAGQTASARLSMAFALWDMGKRDESLESLAEIIERYTVRSSGLKHAFLAALLRGMLLYRFGRIEEGLRELEWVASYDMDPQHQDELLLPGWVRCMVFRGCIIRMQDRTDEALASYDAVLRPFGLGSRWRGYWFWLRACDDIAWAGVFRGMAVGEIRSPEEALKACEGTIERCEVAGWIGREENWIRIFKGVMYEWFHKPDDALREYKSVEKLIKPGALMWDEEAWGAVILARAMGETLKSTR